jgi:hypothetical protein
MERVAIHDPVLLKKLVPLADFGVSPYSVLTPPFLLRSALGLARRIVLRPGLPGPREIDLFAPRDHVKQRAQTPPERSSDAA